MKTAMTMMDDDVHACRYDDDDIFSCTCNHVSNILCSYPVGPLISGPQQTVSQSESDRADPAVSSVFCLFGSLLMQLPSVSWWRLKNSSRTDAAADTAASFSSIVSSSSKSTTWDLTFHPPCLLSQYEVRTHFRCPTQLVLGNSARPEPYVL